MQLVLGKSEFDEDEEEEDEEDEFALPSTSSLLKERPACKLLLVVYVVHDWSDWNDWSGFN